MSRVTAAFLILAVLGLPASPAQADDSDIFGSNIEPNVLILFDNSGSMADSVYSTPYSPQTTYAGTNTPGAVYRKMLFPTRYTLYADSIAQVPDANAQAALSTVGYWSGTISGSWVNLYLGNYLNYQACADCTRMERKIDIARRVVGNLVSSVQGVRFGVMKFRYTPLGGALVAPAGTDTASLVAAINAIQPESTTPLGEQMYDAGQYFKGLYPGAGSPIQYECQPNSIILVTDGVQTGSLDVRAEARARFTEDHHGGFAGTQNVLVHAIGFALSDGDKQAGGLTTLQQAAANGGGTAYTADTAAQLEAALSDSVRQIVAARFAFAAPVIPTTGTSGASRAYLASFQTDPARRFWRGFLKGYQRDANGLVPLDASGLPLASALVWDAGQRLAAKTAQSRTLFTVVNGLKADFAKSNGGLTEALLGVASPAERDSLIDFIRGLDALDEDRDGNITEERAWKLGDIFHSSPVLVGPPFLRSADASYLAYKQAQAGRPAVLLAGANDGLLHAFRESDGEELWGFIPSDLLGRLKDLTGAGGDHPFFVDGSPVAADIKVGDTWKTIVVFGLRRGGRSYHALDITDPTAPGILWSFTDAKLGETWSEPAIGKVRLADGSGRYVAFVGGGYDTGQNNGTGKALFVIDLATGAKLWEYSNDGTPDDRRYMNFSLAAAPAAADLDQDGYVDRIYIGDVGGQLWKFDVGAPATLVEGRVTNWTGKRLVAADPAQANPPPAGAYYPAQAIYVPPALARDAKGNVWVYFGTGDRNHPTSPSDNRFYGIKDTTSMANGSTLTESALVDVTGGTAAASQGWFIRLSANEKVLAVADVFNHAVLFSTFVPSTAAACGGGGGTARLYAISMLTGLAAVDWATGQSVTAPPSGAPRSHIIGTGIASKPIVVIRQTGAVVTTTAVAATTSEQLPSNPVPPPAALKRVLYWREVF